MTTPELLPGASSTRLDRLLAGPFIATLAGFAVFQIGSLVHAPSQITATGAIVAVVFVIPAAIMVVLYLRRRTREENAGYTLTALRRRDLPLLDGATGTMLRTPDEPMPPMRTLRARIAAARRPSAG